MPDTVWETETVFEGVGERYDPVSRACLARIGIGPGWRCLEIGRCGSVGEWLSDRVGPTGSVVAADVEPHRPIGLAERRNVRLLHHDVARDPLPDAEFDLVHARLTLLHLADRHDVLGRLVKALRPGGWLLLEEFDCSWVPVLMAPDAAAAALFEDVHEAVLALLREAGTEPRWGRELYSALVAAGLADVTATTYAEAWPGGGAGIRHHRAATELFRHRLASRGFDDLRLHDFWRLLSDPAFAVASYPLVSAWGRRA